MTTYSLPETCRILGVTRQAVYLQMKNGKLKSEKIKGRHLIDADAIIEFRNNKYSRAKYYGNGYISTRDAARKCNVDPQRIYYLIYFKILPAEQRGSMWFIKVTDLDACDVKQRVRRGKGRK
jgi:hypothetical protein